MSIVIYCNLFKFISSSSSINESRKRYIFLPSIKKESAYKELHTSRARLFVKRSYILLHNSIFLRQATAIALIGIDSRDFAHSSNKPVIPRIPSHVKSVKMKEETRRNT